MRKLIVNEFLTLDGTAQAPGGQEEDTSGGFRHGGWHMQYGSGSGVTKLIGEAGGFLLGRPVSRVSDRKENRMRKLIVNEFLTLDGTAQAPGGQDEDTSGGFRHGGWHMQYGSGSGVTKLIGDAGGFLLGRRTYELFAAYWPNAPEDVSREIADPLNTKPKHVASRTLTGPLEWQNSSVLTGELPDAVAALKAGDGGDLLVIGSTVLVQSLIQQELVDELRLMISPVLVGGGKRIFPDDGALRPLRLVEHEVTDTGAIIATYAPA